MNVTKPSVEIIDMKDYDEMIRKIEKIGRVCYKSEGNITEESAERFIRNILKRGKQLTQKEKRALLFSACILFIYSLTIIMTTFAPWTILRSITGSLGNSPFQQGIYYLISFGIGLSGVVFGYTSGRLRNDRDIIRGMTFLFIRFADYFVILFFIVQFFSSLLYTNLTEWIGIDSSIMVYVFHVCCFIPFIGMLNRKK